MKKIRIKLLWEIFISFLKVGCFTFGGGYAMLPLIQKEVVDNKKWMDENEILDVFAISQSVPGVISLNSSVFIGKKLAGFRGALIAALAVVLPAFLAIIILVTGLSFIKDNPVVAKVFAGIRAASAAMILLSAIKLAKSAIKNKAGALIAAASFILIIVFNISAVWAIILGAAYGLISLLIKSGKSREDSK